MRFLVALVLFAVGCTSTVGASDTGVEASTPCPGPSACYPINTAGTHNGACPSVVWFGNACSDRCLSCAMTGPDGGMGGRSPGPCVCDGTRWVCPSDSGLGCGSVSSTCWLAGPPPTCP